MRFVFAIHMGPSEAARGRGVEWGKGAWVEKMTDDRDGGVFAWRKAKNESYE